MDEDYKKIILSAMSGDKGALGAIIKHEQNDIQSTLYYLNKNQNDFNDILQDILIKVSNKITQLKSPLLFKGWLNQIVINSFYDYLRKKKKAIETIGIDNPQVNEIKDKESSNPQDYVLTRELDNIVKKTITSLPDRYKTVITLREINGLSYDEISRITDTSIGTVKSRISRARTMIKDEIKKYDGDIG